MISWASENVRSAEMSISRPRSAPIVAIIRDWTARDTKREGYPQAPIVTIPITLWPAEDKEQFYLNLVTLTRWQTMPEVVEW